MSYWIYILKRIVLLYGKGFYCKASMTSLILAELLVKHFHHVQCCKLIDMYKGLMFTGKCKTIVRMVHLTIVLIIFHGALKIYVRLWVVVRLLNCYEVKLVVQYSLLSYLIISCRSPTTTLIPCAFITCDYHIYSFHIILCVLCYVQSWLYYWIFCYLCLCLS